MVDTRCHCAFTLFKRHRRNVKCRILCDLHLGKSIWRAKRNSLQRKDMDDIKGALACPQDGTGLRRVMTICGFWALVTSAVPISTAPRVLEGAYLNVVVKTSGSASRPRTSTSFQYCRLLAVRELLLRSDSYLGNSRDLVIRIADGQDCGAKNAHLRLALV